MSTQEDYNLFNTVKNLCNIKGVSIKQMERDLEFSPGMIYKWNSSRPTTDKIIKLALYFDVSTDYLLGMVK